MSMSDDERRAIQERVELLDSSCDALLANVRKSGDSDRKARSRLQATHRQALDKMRDEQAELTSQLNGAEPQPPYAR